MQRGKFGVRLMANRADDAISGRDDEWIGAVNDVAHKGAQMPLLLARALNVRRPHHDALRVSVLIAHRREDRTFDALVTETSSTHVVT